MAAPSLTSGEGAPAWQPRPSHWASGSRAFVRGVGILLREGRDDEALTLCREGVEAHPHFVSGWWMMARVLAALGEDAGAVEWLRALLALSPGHRPAQRLLQRLTPAAPREARGPSHPSKPPTVPRADAARGPLQGEGSAPSPARIPGRPQTAAQPGPIHPPEVSGGPRATAETPAFRKSAETQASTSAPHSGAPADGPGADGEGDRFAPAPIPALPGAGDLRALLQDLGSGWGEGGLSWDVPAPARPPRRDAAPPLPSPAPRSPAPDRALTPPPETAVGPEDGDEEADEDAWEPPSESGGSLASETLGDLYLAQGDEAAARAIFWRLARAGGGASVRAKAEALGMPPAAGRASPEPSTRDLAPAGEEHRIIAALTAWVSLFDDTQEPR